MIAATSGVATSTNPSVGVDQLCSSMEDAVRPDGVEGPRHCQTDPPTVDDLVGERLFAAESGNTRPEHGRHEWAGGDHTADLAKQQHLVGQATADAAVLGGQAECEPAELGCRGPRLFVDGGSDACLEQLARSRQRHARRQE